MTIFRRIIAASLVSVLLYTGNQAWADQPDTSPPESTLVPLLERIWAVNNGAIEIEVDGCVVTRTRRFDGFSYLFGREVEGVDERAFDLADLRPILELRAYQRFFERDGIRYAILPLLLRPERAGALASLRAGFDAEVSRVMRQIEDPVTEEERQEFAMLLAQTMLDTYSQLLSNPAYENLAEFRSFSYGYNLPVLGFRLAYDPSREDTSAEFRHHRFNGPVEEVELAMALLERIQTELCPPPS